MTVTAVMAVVAAMAVVAKHRSSWRGGAPSFSEAETSGPGVEQEVTGIGDSDATRERKHGGAVRYGARWEISAVSRRGGRWRGREVPLLELRCQLSWNVDGIWDAWRCLAEKKAKVSQEEQMFRAPMS